MAVGGRVLGLGQIKRNIALITRRMEEDAIVVIRESTRIVKAETKRGWPEGVSGDLRRELRRGSSKRDLVGYVSADAWYAHFIEFGTRQHSHPGRRGGLQQWVARIVTAGTDVERATFLIARAIARRGGLPATPAMSNAFDAEAPRFHARLRRVLRIR